MIRIRKFKITDTYTVADIVSNTFKKYNNNDGTKKAVSWYINYYNPKKNFENLKASFLKSEIFFVATDGDKIIGMVRGSKDKVINLFVDDKYHKVGVGRKLMEKYEQICIKKGSKEIKLRVSIYAIPFYEKI